MRINQRMNKKSDESNQIRVSKKSLYALFVATFFAIIWVNIGSWTKYGLQINLSESYVPTLINGITTSTSIVYWHINCSSWNYASLFY